MQVSGGQLPPCPCGMCGWRLTGRTFEIYADSLFEKVFYNLIDNALKYGGEAMTTIRITSP